MKIGSTPNIHWQNTCKMLSSHQIVTLIWDFKSNAATRADLYSVGNHTFNASFSSMEVNVSNELKILCKKNLKKKKKKKILSGGGINYIFFRSGRGENFLPPLPPSPTQNSMDEIKYLFVFLVECHDEALDCLITLEDILTVIFRFISKFTHGIFQVLQSKTITWFDLVTCFHDWLYTPVWVHSEAKWHKKMIFPFEKCQSKQLNYLRN